MRIFVGILIGMTALPVLAGDVWRFVNEKGQVEYMDQYREGAEPVTVPKLPTYRPKRVTPLSGRGGAVEEAPTYSDFQVDLPANDATVRNNEGTVPVSLSLQPGLQAGHQIALFLDGKDLGQRVQAMQFNLTGVNRGTHQFQAKVLDESGNSVASTDSVTFHFHQHSVLKNKAAP